MIIGVLRVMIIFLIIVQFFVSSLNYVFFERPDFPVEHRLAGYFLKDSAEFDPDNDYIMSRKPFVSFYSGSKRSLVGIPYTNAANILKFAKANKANYIVIDERFLSIRENYDELWNLDRFSNDARLIFEDSSIMPIRIFRFQDANYN